MGITRRFSQSFIILSPVQNEGSPHARSPTAIILRGDLFSNVIDACTVIRADTRIKQQGMKKVDISLRALHSHMTIVMKHSKFTKKKAFIQVMRDTV